MSDWSIYKNHGSDGKGNLVDPAQLPAAQEHKITIDIIPNANTSNTVVATIEGFMKEPFNYSVGAQYNKIIDIPAAGGLVRYGKDIINADASYHSGFFTKKMFEPGNAYSKLDLKFRVYDKPDVIQECDLLVACCLPMIAGNINGSRNPVLNTNLIGVGTGIIAGAIDATKNISIDDLTNGFVGVVGSGLKTIMGVGTTRKPPHLTVKIGSYFIKYDMVLTNVDFTYSKEFIFNSKTKSSYPAFVDFSITVESLYSMLGIDGSDEESERRFGTGFRQQGESRVNVVNSAVNENPVSAVWESFKSGWNSKRK